MSLHSPLHCTANGGRDAEFPLIRQFSDCTKVNGMQIYVGNLPEAVDDAALRTLFAEFGEVLAATIGKEKGYGFVEMRKASEARAAVHGLRGKEMEGKPLRVKVLKPGDEFHAHAQALHGGRGVKGEPRFRGDGTYRGSGAIRRGGQRGT